LLRLIPPELHASLAVVTIIGIEISIQTICRTEPEYVVVRGRLSGTAEGGRVFFLPYDQINYVGIQLETSDARLRELYREPPAISAAPERSESNPDVPVPAETPLPAPIQPPAAPVEPTPPPEQGRPSVRPPLLGKTKLIARLRSRGQGGSSS